MVWAGDRKGNETISRDNRSVDSIRQGIEYWISLYISRRSMLTVDAVMEGLLPQLLNHLSLLSKTLSRLRRTPVFIFTKQLLHYLSTMYFDYTTSRDKSQWWNADRSRVGAVAGLLYNIYKEDKLSDIFIDVIKNGSGFESIQMQRACVLAVSKFGGQYLESVLL